MPTINVSERDFEIVASAAIEAQARGDKAAKDLDKLARKMNLALTQSKMSRELGHWSSILTKGRSKRTWRSMPSVLLKRSMKG